MTWPPQSPYLNPIDMVWDEVVRRGKMLIICGNSIMTDGKTIQVKLVERMPRVFKAVFKAKGGYFEESQIYLICLTLYWLVHDSICVFS